MKAEYLNPVIDSYRKTFESVLQTQPEKGELTKLELYETEKELILNFEVEGDLNGTFGICFDTNIAIKIADVMTGGMANKEELDEMGESCVQELGNMIKGSMINELQEAGYSCDVEKVELLKKTELVPLPDILLKIKTNTNIGEIELVLKLN